MSLRTATLEITPNDNEVGMVALEQQSTGSSTLLKIDTSQSSSQPQIDLIDPKTLELLGTELDGNSEKQLEVESSQNSVEPKVSGVATQPDIAYNLECDACGYRTKDPILAEVHSIQTDHLSFETILEIQDEIVADPIPDFAKILQRKTRRDDYPDTLGALQCVADIIQGQTEREEKEQKFRQWLRDMEPMLGMEHPEMLRTVHKLAIVLHEQGRNEESEKLHRKALEGRIRVLGEEHLETLHSLGSMALVLDEKNGTWEGVECHRRALRGFENVLGYEHPDTLKSANDLANILQQQDNYEEAEALYRRVVKARERVLGSEHVDTLTSLSNLASAMKIQDNYHEAEKLYRRVLLACEQKYGRNSAETVKSCYDLARVLHEEDKTIEAKAIFERVAKGRNTILADERSSEFSLKEMCRLGTEFRAQEKFRAAEELLQIGSEGLEMVLGKYSEEAIHGSVNFGNVLMDRRKYARAEKIYVQALERVEIALGKDHTDRLAILNNLGAIAGMRGTYNKAIEMFRLVMEGSENAFGKEHTHTLTALNNLVDILRRQKKFDSSNEMLKEGLTRLKKASQMGYFGTSMGRLLRQFEKDWSELLLKEGGIAVEDQPQNKATAGTRAGPWVGAQVARGYADIGDEVDMPNLEIGNADREFGGIRDLFSPSAPKSKVEGDKSTTDKIEDKDFVISDVDEQLMLFIPFKRVLKVHSIHLTSLISTNEEDETSKRPRTIKFVINRPNMLGFEENAQFVQEVELREQDWNNETGTAVIHTRFVKFQSVSTLGIFIEDGLEPDMSDGSQEGLTRLDRVRIIGELR